MSEKQSPLISTIEAKCLETGWKVVGGFVMVVLAGLE